MEYNDHDLYHWGIKGMKWGVRRYQNKDGSLTPAGRKRYDQEMDKLKGEKRVLKNKERTNKKLAKLKSAKDEVDELKKRVDDEETLEQKRERLLKSNDPKELYENKHLLTTAELNERINRIDTESRLQSKIVEEKKQTGLDYINDKMKSSTETINNAKNFFKSIDESYSTVVNSSIGKMLAKQLGIETPKKDFNLQEMWNKRNKLTTQEMLDLNKRVMAEKSVKNYMDSLKKEADDRAAADKATADVAERLKQAQKQVDDYNKNRSQESSTYSKKGSDVVDNKVGTGNKDSTSKLGIEMKERYEATGNDVIGKGTSTYSEKDKGPIIDVEEGNGYRTVSSTASSTGRSYMNNSNNYSTSNETRSTGQNYIAGLLEDKNK